jgi:hypothetical protein
VSPGRVFDPDRRPPPRRHRQGAADRHLPRGPSSSKKATRTETGVTRRRSSRSIICLTTSTRRWRCPRSPLIAVTIVTSPLQSHATRTQDLSSLSWSAARSKPAPRGLDHQDLRLRSAQYRVSDRVERDLTDSVPTMRRHGDEVHFGRSRRGQDLRHGRASADVNHQAPPLRAQLRCDGVMASIASFHPRGDVPHHIVARSLRGVG